MPAATSTSARSTACSCPATRSTTRPPADGNLHSVAFDNGAPDATTDTVVSGPSIDGNDWRARGMFLDTETAPTASFTQSCTG